MLGKTMVESVAEQDQKEDVHEEDDPGAFEEKVNTVLEELLSTRNPNRVAFEEELRAILDLQEDASECDLSDEPYALTMCAMKHIEKAHDLFTMFKNEIGEYSNGSDNFDISSPKQGKGLCIPKDCLAIKCLYFATPTTIFRKAVKRAYNQSFCQFALDAKSRKKEDQDDYRELLFHPMVLKGVLGSIEDLQWDDMRMILSHLTPEEFLQISEHAMYQGGLSNFEKTVEVEKRSSRRHYCDALSSTICKGLDEVLQWREKYVPIATALVHERKKQVHERLRQDKASGKW